MHISIKKILLSALLLSGSALQATTISEQEVNRITPLQAYTTQQQDYTSVVYYTVLPSGDYEIVTTQAPNEGVAGLSTQTRMIISVNQSYSIDLNQGLGNNTVGATTITALQNVLQIAQK